MKIRLNKNKKGVDLPAETVVAILIILVGFITILLFIKFFAAKADTATAEIMCRASIMAREKTTTDKFMVKDVTPVPLLCKSLEIKIPITNGEKKEDVEREFADAMARCWWQFGEGLVGDVFKETSMSGQNCMMCYIVSTGKTINRENLDQNTISQEEFTRYLLTTPYKVASPEMDQCKNLGGFCAASKEVCSQKSSDWDDYEDSPICKEKYGEGNIKGPVCCFSGYDCLNNGGECLAEGAQKEGYEKYTKWDCPQDSTCYVKEADLITYAEYIQSYSGKGNIVITSAIEPQEIYAISFGSPNGENAIAKVAGGVVGIATTGILIVVSPLSGGTTLYAAGPAGVAAGAFATHEFREAINFWSRDVSTIYLTKLKEAQDEDKCNRVRDVKNG